MSMMQCTDLRLGSSSATLYYLRDQEIPDPDEFTYVPYSVKRIDGAGLPKGYGYPSCSWSWEALDQAAMNRIFSYFSAATDAGVQVYISTYTDTGRRRTTSDYTAYMHRPVDGDGKEMYPGSVGQVSQNVSISFTRLEAA